MSNEVLSWTDIKKQIDTDVSKAYTNRRISSISVPTDSVVESEEENKNFYNKIKNLADEDMFETDPFSPTISEVYVDSPHLFLYLIYATMRITFGEKDALKETYETFHHELEHYFQTLDMPGIKVRFGIEIFEDRKIPQDKAMSAFVSIEGQIKVSHIKRFYLGPAELSHSDKVCIGLI